MLLALALFGCTSSTPVTVAPDPVSSEVGKVVLLAVDGASWKVIDPLMAAGDMPNLASVVARGCRGTMTSMLPSESPRIWTSVATGVPPKEHGITGFVYEEDGRKHLFTAAMVKVPTLWEMVSSAELPVGVTNYWFTYPVRAVNGFMVSDQVMPWRSARMNRKFAGGESAGPAARDLVYPRRLRKRVNALIAENPAGVKNLKPVNREKAFQAQRTMIAENELVFRIAEEAVRHNPVRLDIRYLKGIDASSHFYWRYWDPTDPAYSGPPDPVDLAVYRDFVPMMYRHFDALLGRLLPTLAPEDVLLIVSDHGFEGRSGRKYVTGKHGGASSRDGIYVAAGGPLQASTCPERISLFDITPSVLHLLGLQVPSYVDGAVVSDWLDPDWLVAHPVRMMQGQYPRPEWPKNSAAVVPDEGDRIEWLQTLGYMDGGEEASP